MGSEVSDSNRENLTDAQKNFLTEVFQEREHTSKKADPTTAKILTFSTHGEDFEEHEANGERDIQELTDRGTN